MGEVFQDSMRVKTLPCIRAVPGLNSAHPRISAILCHRKAVFGFSRRIARLDGIFASSTANDCLFNLRLPSETASLKCTRENVYLSNTHAA